MCMNTIHYNSKATRESCPGRDICAAHKCSVSENFHEWWWWWWWWPGKKIPLHWELSNISFICSQVPLEQAHIYIHSIWMAILIGIVSITLQQPYRDKKKTAMLTKRIPEHWSLQYMNAISSERDKRTSVMSPGLVFFWCVCVCFL